MKMIENRGVCKLGFSNRVQMVKLPTINVNNQVNSRGSRSTFRKGAEIGLLGIIPLYINCPCSAIVREDMVRKYTARFAQTPNCEGMDRCVYWGQRSKKRRSALMDTVKKSPGMIINLVFKGVALAMAVAVVVTGVLGVMDPRAQITMLGIGLFGLAITSLDKE